MEPAPTPEPSTAERGADDATLEGRIVLLIAALASEEPSKRRSARLALEAIGQPAVPFLIQELRDMEESVREEAIRALSAIGDPSAIPALMVELEDQDSSCRWLAAEALGRLGDEALAALLRALEDGSASVHLRQGIRHALHDLKNDRPGLIVPVLDAFQSDIPEIALRGAASAALHSLGLEA